MLNFHSLDSWGVITSQCEKTSRFSLFKNKNKKTFWPPLYIVKKQKKAQAQCVSFFADLP